jgi:site-specific DNA recombinase
MDKTRKQPAKPAQPKPPKPFRAVAYIRVSTNEQATEGVSLEAQTVRLRGYCVAMGWGEPEIVEDAGVSAKNLDRLGLQGILEAVKRKQVDRLLVVKLDRLTRSVSDLEPLLRALERGGCELVSLGESLDTSNAAGRLMLNLLVSVSQWEREAIAERTKTALRHKRGSQAVYNHTPLGFNRAGDRLERNEPEYATACRILTLHDEGQGLNAIARLMNAEGVPTKSGGAWYASTVKRIVDRPELYA